MNMNSCNNCDCWERIMERGVRAGECRRYPPERVSIILHGLINETEMAPPVFTKSNYYCGEWRCIATEQVGVWPFVIGVIRLLRG